MHNEYDQILRDYNVPAGVLTSEELKMLREGGIRLEDSDQEYEHYQTQPKLPRYPQQGYPQSNLQIESLKGVYEEQLAIKDSQIKYLQREIENRDALMQAERRRMKSQFLLEQEKLEAQTRKARAKVIHSQGQIPLIKEAINQVREMMSGMISETTYLRLKDLPERELPPSEWLLVNVWELVYPYRKELEYTKKEVNKLRQEITIMNDKQHSLLNELEHYSRLLASKDDDEKRHSLNYENNRKSMELEIDKLREQLQLNREKGARYDELLRDFQLIKQEKELMEEKLSYYDKQTAGSGDQAKFSREQGQRRKMELLTNDKEHLTKENIKLLENNRYLQDRCDRIEAELLRERSRGQELQQAFMNVKTDSMSNYEQRIYREIAELKEKHNHELEMSKNNLIDIYEKQLRFVKESLEEKELKLEATERNLREKNKEHQQLMLDARDFQRKFDGDLAETRIQLKIRTEELDRINNIYQETLGNLNAHKLQNDMLREKLNVVKGEYFKTEANNKDQLSSLKAQVAVLREQLANYQLIEKEIDQAVVSLAQINPNDNTIFTNTLNSVPTSSKRRIQQALGLAQRLQAKQKENEQTQELLRQKQLELQRVQSELKLSKSLLEKSNQPYSYLVGNIEQKEKEIILLRNENRKLDQNYENMKQEYRELKRQLEEAERDIQRLLVKRESIQNIQNILVDLTRGPTSATQINHAVEEIKDILGNSALRKPSGAISSKPTTDGPSWYKKLLDKKK